MSDDFLLKPEDHESAPMEKARGLFYQVPRKVRIVGCIVLAAAVIIALLNIFKPQAKKRPIPETVVRVDTVTAGRSTYPIVVRANGTIEAETRGDLVAQVSGEIVSVADNFKTGGTFKKGDALVQIDRRDYLGDLSQTLAELSQSEAAFRQEQANAKQAAVDWERLGNTTPAPDLVLRKPQLAAAKAQFESAQVAKQGAELNLSRTTITAPYDGRVIQRNAVLGQYVSVGSPIAEVFATQGVEVRLPISQTEFNQLGLDEFVAGAPNNTSFDVVINSTIGSRSYTWNAKITRTDSTFDINTRQIDVIAVVEDPFGKENNQPALKIGQFVSARIQGRNVDNVFVIPNKSIREGSYIYVVRDERLSKQSIDILWQDDQNALISDGIAENELVVTTSLNSTLAGARAKMTEPAADPIAQVSESLTEEPEPLAQETEPLAQEQEPLAQETEDSSQDQLNNQDTEQAAQDNVVPVAPGPSDTDEGAIDVAPSDNELPTTGESNSVINAAPLDQPSNENQASPDTTTIAPDLTNITQTKPTTVAPN